MIPMELIWSSFIAPLVPPQSDELEDSRTDEENNPHSFRRKR